MDYGVGNIQVFLYPAKIIIPKVRLSATSELWGFLSSFSEESLISFFFFLEKMEFSLLLKIITSKPFGNCKVLWSPPQLHTEVACHWKMINVYDFHSIGKLLTSDLKSPFSSDAHMEYLWQCSKLAHPSSLIFCVWQEHVKSIFLSALQAPDLEYSPFFILFFLGWFI